MQQRIHALAIRSVAGALLAAALVMAGCSADSSGTTQSPSGSTSANPTPGGGMPTAVAQAQTDGTQVNPAIVTADNSFGLNLLHSLLPASSGGNIAISPLSVALALQVLYNGAAGSTQQAMAQTMQIGGLDNPTLNSDNAALQASLVNPDPKVQLAVANSLWINLNGTPVLPSFTQTDETYYGATVGDLAGAPANVNAWVDNETHGLITQLMPAGVYQDAIIANVLYFKGQWTTSFNPADTAAAPFTLSDGSQMSAQLMHQSGSLSYTAGTLHGSGFQAVQMPYGQGRLAMLIVLPDASVDITNFVAGITADDLKSLGVQLHSSAVNLALPRFSASYGTSLSPALASLGMGIVFTQSADFSALAPGFSVNVVEHKTVVEVDETGTVAAAATGIGEASVMPMTVTMTMDHPFFYAIQDNKTGLLLFVGVLMNPS